MRANNKLLYLLALGVLLFFGILGYNFLTGLPPLFMMLLAMVIGLLLLVAMYSLAQTLSRVLPKVHPPYLMAIFSAVLCLIGLKIVGFGWPNSIYYPVVAVLLLFLCGCYAYYRLRSRTSLGVLIVALAGLVAVFYAMARSGMDPYKDTIPLPEDFYDTVNGLPNTIKDPSAPGNRSVRQFTYGSGTDKKRLEYSKNSTFTTPTVDATYLLPDWKGKKKKWRERYWGFGTAQFPLNGRVYFPEGKGPFPLVLIVHGNHSMIDYSDNGYGYLGRLLASRGHIAVSVDENFVNGHWSGDFMGKEMPVRAWLLLKHLEQWQTWNRDREHPLFGTVDMDNIMLIGHSRGGEAVAMAGVYNRLSHFPDDSRQRFSFNFNIKGIVSLAPTDYRYDRKMVLENVNYLSLQGSYDADEVSFWGMRPYRRLRFTDSLTHIKAGIYIHRANHGQFNSTWGRSDFGAPRKWLLNLAPLMPQEQQQKLAQLFISAFAEATFKEDRAFDPLFKNPAKAKKWLPNTYILSSYGHSLFEVWAGFEEDLNLLTASNGLILGGKDLALWKEINIQTRDKKEQDNNAVVLAWDNGAQNMSGSKPRFTLSWPKGETRVLAPEGELQLSIAPGDPKWLEDSQDRENSEENKEEGRTNELLPDFSIVLKDEQGQTASVGISEVKKIPPRLLTQFTKFPFLEKDMAGDAWEVQMQSYHFPLQLFATKNNALDLSKIVQLLLIFDKTNEGVLVVDDIGYTPNTNAL